MFVHSSALNMYRKLNRTIFFSGTKRALLIILDCIYILETWCSFWNVFHRFFCNEQKVKQEKNIFIDRILSECSSIYMPQVVFGSLYVAIQSFITFAIKSNFNWNERRKKTRQCFHLIHTMTLHVSGENIDYQHNNSIQCCNAMG